MGVGGNALAVGCKVVYTTQAWVFYVGSFDVDGLKLFTVFLVGEGDGDIVGSAEERVVKRKDIAVLEKANASEEKDLGLFGGAARSVKIFTASQTEEKGSDHKGHRYAVERAVNDFQQVG